MQTVYFTDRSVVEQNALQSLLAFEENQNIGPIAVFPDIHYCSERSIPVGVAFQTTDVFYPLVIGKDMGCGVAYLRIPRQDVLRPFDKAKHYRALEREVHRMTEEGLGGGNHFLSLEASAEYLYIIVHTGSRNLGIYMYQQNCRLLQEHSPGNDWLPIEVATPDYRREYERVLRYAASRRREFVSKTYDFLQRNQYVGAGTPVFADSCHNLLEFSNGRVIHRKGSTQLVAESEVVIPLSMSRGSLIVKPNRWSPTLEQTLWSCAHGAGRQYSRTDTLKFWHSLKKADKDAYRQRFAELLNRQGDFDSSILQEFDFAYKDSAALLATQPHLILCDETQPIVTVKFTGV
ncbi:RtcB family protein [Hymenobacter cellulosilyticus]|uniref:3'-phosphate/5'-hydroxy nucleic acid ligase n=1 Tax=Hymenobacter cellulosilyticus TaxID=2932248 RepID=A0A8T9QCD0_9BACT|nr:RtcB family protein [Hymenobacter cellulosilyticus]UOQ74592.1 RtcB family protein [Hymenobacter cellulosilyticus]